VVNSWSKKGLAVGLGLVEIEVGQPVVIEVARGDHRIARFIAAGAG